MILAATTTSSQLEIVVSAPDDQRALETANSLRALAYTNGSATFCFPVISTLPIKDLLDVLFAPPDVKGIVPGLQFSILEPMADVVPARAEWRSNTQHLAWAPFESALSQLGAWQSLLGKHPRIRTFESALLLAPLIRSRSQSLLTLWTGIESLFDTRAELSFRISLYLAQLIGEDGDRHGRYRRAKRAYDTRSGAAHGSHAVTEAEWLEAWGLMREVARGLLARGELPKDEALVEELLGE
jgi:hypothetical protein